MNETHDTSFDRHPTDFEKQPERPMIDVRCPYFREVNGKQTECKQLVLRVLPGSAGVAKCRHCKRMFEFNVAA